jgi:protein-disulfide isomerase
LAGDRLVEGNASSPVRVLVYEDLQCPDCAALRRMMDAKLLPRFGAKVGFEHRDFPLPKHSWARRAAIAARFFQGVRPELAVKFRRETMAALAMITPEAFGAHVAAFARSNGVDPAKAAAALADPNLAKLVDADYQEGVARGVAKTPTVFVEGEPFIETFTFEELAKAIEAAGAKP